MRAFGGCLTIRERRRHDGGPACAVVTSSGAASNVAIDVTRLCDHHGHLSAEEQWGVDLALETVLDLR